MSILEGYIERYKDLKAKSILSVEEVILMAKYSRAIVNLNGRRV